MEKNNKNHTLRKGLDQEKDPNKFTITGEVIESHRGGLFKIKLDDSDCVINATVAGKLRRFKISLIPGDRVKCEISGYDLSRGIIIWRERK